MLTQRARLAGTLVCSWVVLMTAFVGWAQAAPAPAPAATKPAEAPPATKPAETPSGEPGPAVTTKGKKVAELWEDFCHYIKIARPDLAKIFGEAMLESGADPREIYMLSINTPDSPSVLARGQQASKELKDVIVRIRKVIEDGYKGDRADPKQIERAIQMLTEGERAYALGAERLKASGEYALPQLIQKLGDAKSSTELKARVIALLPELGKEAVRGMSCALQTKDPELQQILLRALAQLEYPHAAARIKELLERKDILDRTRKDAEAALIACSGAYGRDIVKKSAAELFYDLADKYYYRADSLRPDERFDKASIWYWQEGLGLTFRPVKVLVFYDIYAMRMARLALQNDPKYYQAVSLWLAAYINREADQAGEAPAPAATQAAAAELLPATFYILASSAKYQQDVLARAIRDKSPVMAEKAIEALVQTAGAKSLVEPVAGSATPLVDALSFPDRKVRFLAAETLAKALPEKKFAGSQFVVSTLVEALRQTGKKSVVLIASDQAQRAVLKDAMRAGGYDVIDDPKPTEAIRLARESAGVDVFVVGDRPDAGDVLTMLRGDSLFSGMPLVVAGQSSKLRETANKDGRVVLIDADAKGEAVAQALVEAVNRGTGKPFTPEQAVDWAVRAADAIRLIGVTNNPAYDVSAAHKALIAALGHPDPKAQGAAAKALAVMPGPEAQRAIAAIGLKAGADEKVRVEALEATTESARKFGSQLTDEQTQAVVDLVAAKGGEALRVAAARLLGSLNLPSEKIKDLIAGTAGSD